MRYRGQGHELTVAIPAKSLTAASSQQLERLYIEQYEQQFGRSIPGLVVEIVSWALRLATADPVLPPCPAAPPHRTAAPVTHIDVADPATGGFIKTALHIRSQLTPGDTIPGPALIVEDETTTLVTSRMLARINGLGHIVMTRS